MSTPRVAVSLADDTDGARPAESAPPLVAMRTSGGLEVGIRSATTADRQLVFDGFERLSDRSRHNRFFTSMPRLSERLVDQLLATGPDRLVLIGFVRQTDGSWSAVGGVQAIRSRDDRTAADLAVTVVDAHQGKGIGTLLVAAMAAVADEVGISRIEADVLAVNRPMLAVLRSLPAELRRQADDATVVATGFPTGPVAALLDPDDRAELIETVLGPGTDLAPDPPARTATQWP